MGTTTTNNFVVDTFYSSQPPLHLFNLEYVTTILPFYHVGETFRHSVMEFFDLYLNSILGRWDEDPYIEVLTFRPRGSQ